MSSKPEPTALEKGLVFAAIKNHAGPITKAELVAKTALCDRVIREAVSCLVLDGHPIASNRSSGGYEYTHDMAKIEAEHASLLSHAKHIKARADALAKHLSPQTELFR